MEEKWSYDDLLGKQFDKRYFNLEFGNEKPYNVTWGVEALGQ